MKLLTNPEKLRALAVIAELYPDDLQELRSRLFYLITDLEQQIERKRPGFLMDERLGRPGDRPVNMEDRT